MPRRLNNHKTFWLAGNLQIARTSPSPVHNAGDPTGSTYFAPAIGAANRQACPHTWHALHTTNCKYLDVRLATEKANRSRPTSQRTSRQETLGPMGGADQLVH